MDLYSYSRCSDQTKYENIHHFFRDTVRPFIEKVTGFHFRVRTSVNISLYGSGGELCLFLTKRKEKETATNDVSLNRLPVVSR